MTARAVMVLGCTSGAGKSWLSTALCRWYARQGLKVAPFKAQNMSNHARVVRGPDGEPAEMGSAQWLQALAARVPPDPRMNPVLLKPEADTRSQVVLMGQARPDLADVPWRARSAHLWPQAEAALHSLMADHDVVVIEGAGSPAEINLADSDFVNTFTAVAAQAACLLVSDIDRGGAFAHLYGTHALMDARVRALTRGFVLNRFRGDAALLAPGPQMLQASTGVPTLAVIPMVQGHGLPEEDAVPADHPQGAGPCIVVLAGPHASNLDEFEPLRTAGARLQFSRSAHDVAAADVLILPGSKHTRADLAWLRGSRLDQAVLAHAALGKPLLAVCGGMQMLGQTIVDEAGHEGGTPGQTEGLGLLPLRTHFGAAKTLADRRYQLGALTGPWQAWSGLVVQGYEIHQGQTEALDASLQPAAPTAPGLGWQQGPVLGLYLHGLMENPALLQAWLGLASRPLDAVFDRLADEVDRAFEPGVLSSLLAPIKLR